MGKVYVDVDEMKRIGDELKEAADHFGVLADNIQWKSDLKQYERIMIDDVKNEFMLREFNGNADEFNRISKLSLDYSELSYYYKYRAERDRNFKSLGVIIESKYDCNLTLAEAVAQYLGCSLEEAVDANNKMRELNRKYDYYEASIRNNYKGSLGVLVGKSDEEYKNANPEPETAINAEDVAAIKDELNKFKPSEEAKSKVMSITKEFVDFANNVEKNGPTL